MEIDQSTVTLKGRNMAMTSDTLPPDDTYYSNPFFWFVSAFLILTLLTLNISYMMSTSSLIVSDQPVGLNFEIKKIEVYTPGFLVLKTHAGKQPDKILFSTDLLKPGVYVDTTLVADSLGESVLNGVWSLDSGTKINALVFKDVDSDGIYNEQIDNVVEKSFFGQTAQTFFSLR